MRASLVSATPPQRAERFLLLAGSLAWCWRAWRSPWLRAVQRAPQRLRRHHEEPRRHLGPGQPPVRWQPAAAGAVATAIGCLLGWAIQAVFFALFGDQLPVQPGPSGPRPYAIGAATALTCLLCFAWPPLRRLALASPLRVLRRDTPAGEPPHPGDYALGLVAVALLMWAYSRDWQLTLAVLAGLAIMVSCSAWRWPSRCSAAVACGACGPAVSGGSHWRACGAAAPAMPCRW